MTLGHRRDGGSVSRPAVDDENRMVAPDGCQTSVQLSHPVQHRHDDGDVRPHIRCRARVDEPAVDETPSQPGCASVEHRLQGGRRAQADEPAGIAAEQHAATVERVHPPVEDDRERHSERPPSTGTTAPVTPPLPPPASHTSARATSSGSSSRPSGCCGTKACAPGSP